MHATPTFEGLGSRSIAIILLPVSCENGDPPNWGPHVPILMEKWGPGSIFAGNWGPSHENGDPQCWTCRYIDWNAQPGYD